MRISDWSSDVCSSDLAARERGCAFLVSHVAPSTYDDLSALMATNRADGVIFLGQRSLFAEFHKLAQILSPNELGSARCRERVCQYVSFSVVAVSLKKK